MAEQVLLTKDSIQQMDKTITGEYVPVPEWGGKVFIRSLSSVDADRWKQKAYDCRKSNGSMSVRQLEAELVSLCISDEDGNPLFTVNEVSSLRNAAVTRIFRRCVALNGLHQDQQSAEAELDERGKHSSPTDGDATG